MQNFYKNLMSPLLSYGTGIYKHRKLAKTWGLQSPHSHTANAQYQLATGTSNSHYTTDVLSTRHIA